ncbi:isochorismate synthase [Mobilicoccus caccae]|uniref:isochorismate synthase n=1 Tax=Mobilicoccus caccae TaxID=1859295 RepID=A0ABQ6IRS5_9MICO|nr:isochorismate synthase [Mobilicoccus caccae]GMA40644.1 isochorismate synthase [Mobilicoccus caccae]
MTSDVPTRLLARTREVDDVRSVLAHLPAGADPRELCSWVRGGDGIVGWGRVAGIATCGDSRFADAETWWRQIVADAEVVDEVDLVGTGLVAFGSFAYSSVSAEQSVLAVPRVILGRRDGRSFVTTVTTAAEAERGRPGAAGADVQAETELPDPPGEVSFADGALAGPAWQTAVAEAVRRISAGELDKVVLARDLIAESESPIDPRFLLERLAEVYGTTWVFAVDGLVGATPEMLVRLERGLVTSRVLAGTIRRTGDDDRDLALAASLAHSSKDLEEHEYAVASVADVIARYCTSVNMPETPFVLHLPNVLHLATDVAGRLTNGASSLTLAQALHPSAAVCGTPKPVADMMIADLEHMDRGRYAGPVGWIDDHGDGEWGIALRSGALDPVDPRRMRLFAGCGIVAGSDPEAELAESDAKLVPMRTALAAPTRA